MIKICRNCDKEFPKTEEYFHWANKKRGYFQSICKKCHNKRVKLAYKQNPEKTLIRTKKWNQNNLGKVQDRVKRWVKENPEKRRINARRYYEKNTEKCNKAARKWQKENHEKVLASDRKQRKTPKGNLSHRMKAGIQIALKGNKNGYKWESLVGYTCEDLKKHLENLFRDGMSWENMGEWHIDHKIPKTVFNYTKPEHIDFKKCWALDNLQPLWAKENRNKSAKLVKHFQPSLQM